MKKIKKNHIIIALVVLLLALAIGYAAFSTELNVKGTATGNGTWNIKFGTPALKDSNGSTDTKHGNVSLTTTTVENDTITANIDLAFPGDGVILEVPVTNAGTIPAKLDTFEITGVDENIEISQATQGVEIGEKLGAGKTCTAQFAIKWKTTSKVSNLGAKTFNIRYVYNQDTTEVNLTPTHVDN